MLVRLAKHIAAWDEGNVEKLESLDFRTKNGEPDLRISAYDIEKETDLIRVCAEHCAAFLDVRTMLPINITDTTNEICITPGAPKFSFIRDRHREVIIQNDGQLRVFVSKLLETISSRRLRRATKQDIKTYAEERVKSNDEEWIKAISDPNAKEWLRRLQVASVV